MDSTLSSKRPCSDAVRLSADQALRTRRSVRAFLPTPVPRTEVEELLALASRSPSGSNIQPWKVHVFSGALRQRITREIWAALDAGRAGEHKREWNYYPQQWREPYLGRRRKIGWDMYGLLGIPKGDFARTEAQRRQNYDFFGAPVGMMFTLDEDMEIGSWLDLGIFLGSLAVAARGHGLDTCPQAAFADFHRILRPLLGIPDNEIIICGMALGHADSDAPVNRLRTERAAPGQFARFEGFEE
ncbi:nitroreductase [Ramlibacter alkalitolerans]|uniref:nitroreductase n=1 Tax=Ramlibacter alkalitolerans TaxID=2039631 RepID=UPI002ED4F8E7